MNDHLPWGEMSDRKTHAASKKKAMYACVVRVFVQLSELGIEMESQEYTAVIFRQISFETVNIQNQCVTY